MSSIIQKQNLNLKPVSGGAQRVLFGLNPAVVKARMHNLSKVQLVEQALLISEVLQDQNLRATERSCLLSLYKYCKTLYQSKYLK